MNKLTLSFVGVSVLAGCQTTKPVEFESQSIESIMKSDVEYGNYESKLGLVDEIKVNRDSYGSEYYACSTKRGCDSSQAESKAFVGKALYAFGDFSYNNSITSANNKVWSNVDLDEYGFTDKTVTQKVEFPAFKGAVWRARVGDFYRCAVKNPLGDDTAVLPANSESPLDISLLARGSVELRAESHIKPADSVSLQAFGGYCWFDFDAFAESTVFADTAKYMTGVRTAYDAANEKVKAEKAQVIEDAAAERKRLDGEDAKNAHLFKMTEAAQGFAAVDLCEKKYLITRADAKTLKSSIMAELKASVGNKYNKQYMNEQYKSSAASIGFLSDYELLEACQVLSGFANGISAQKTNRF